MVGSEPSAQPSASSQAAAAPRARPDESVRTWRTMLQIHAELIGELETRFRREHGLSVSEFDVLVNLDPRKPLRHMELADRVILSRTALTRLLDRLQARGWVQRGTASQDQRGVVVTLTERGRRVRSAAARTNNATIRRYFAGLSSAELDTLHGLVTTLRRHHPAHQ